MISRGTTATPPGLRALIVTPAGREIGGSEVMLDRFLASAAREGISCHVVFLEGGDHFDSVRAAGYPCELVESGRLHEAHRWLSCSRRLLSIIRARKPEAVIGWQSKVVAYAGLPSRLAGVPFFCFHRGVPGSHLVDWLSWALPCDGYLANSRFTAAQLMDHTSRPVAVVHSAVDHALFATKRLIPAREWKSRLGFDPDLPLVGIVGRLQHWKGMHHFLAALARLRNHRIHCRGVIVGGAHRHEPGYPDQLKQLIGSLGLADHVLLAGARHNASEWMAAMDIVVHASDKEPFGLVVIEGMALGKPVIATVPGGPGEVITHGRDGLLVPHGDVPRMAAAIRKFLADPAFAAACGQAAGESSRRFDSSRYAHAVLSAIDEIEWGGRRQSAAAEADTPLHLLIVMPSASYRGGAEEALLQLVQARSSAGLRLDIIFLEDGELPNIVRGEGVGVHMVDAGRLREAGQFLRCVREIRRIAAKIRPDAILSWMTKAHIYGGLAAHIGGIPAIYFQMGVPDNGIVDILCRLVPAAGAIACSDFAAREQAQRVDHPVLGVCLAADPGRFYQVADHPAAEMKRKLGFDPSRPLIGIVGRLQRWKGMHVFARAIAQARLRRPDIQGVIVGGPHDLEPDYPGLLAGELDTLGLGDNLRLAGARNDVPDWMQAMDIVVHASEREPFGIVVVEAMVLGKPVIATRPGGPEEIIEDGVSGLLVPHGDSALMAAAMLRFLGDPAFAARCGAAARRRARHFTPRRFAQRVSAAAHRLLGRPLNAAGMGEKP